MLLLLLIQLMADTTWVVSLEFSMESKVFFFLEKFVYLNSGWIVGGGEGRMPEIEITFCIKRYNLLPSECVCARARALVYDIFPVRRIKIK